MKITAIHIRGLFDLFDYDIALDNPENISILTGPNGFGKTTILNILYNTNLVDRGYSLFSELIFKKLTITIENEMNISIEKSINRYGKKEISYSFAEGKQNIQLCELPKSIQQKVLNHENVKNKRTLNDNFYAMEILGICLSVYLIKDQRLYERTFKNDEISGETFFKNTLPTYNDALKRIFKQSTEQLFAISQEL